MSSYSFHGRAVPKLLAESGKLKSEALVTKCKLSLCLPCFKSTAGAKESKSVTNANEANGSPASSRYSPSGTHLTEMKTETMESYANRNESIAAEKGRNGSDIQIRLTPSFPTPIEQPQSCGSSSTKDAKPETSLNSNSRFLEVRPSWTRTLSVISENETTEVDNHFVNANDCNGQKRVKFPEISPGMSPVGSPRGSQGSLQRWDPQGKAVKHRKEDLSRWKFIRMQVSKLTLDPLFDMFITFCILVNTVFLSLEYHGMNEKFKMALDVGNMVSILRRKGG